MKKRKYTEEIKKIFSRATGPIPTNPSGEKHSWLKGIQVHSSEVQYPLLSGDD